MRQEDKLKEKFGKELPFKLPEGYFKSFGERIAERLPEYPETAEVRKVSAWHRVRPYIYLAAMFAGIWCMMQIFHRVSTAGDSRHDEFANVVYDPDSFDFYIDDTSGEDFAIQEEVLNLYPNLDEFKRDFYAQL